MEKISRHTLGLITILMISALLLGLMLNGFLTIVNHDSAIFCILANSLLKGHYLLVSEPTPQPYFTFPPFLAVQLAGLMLLFGNTDALAMQSIFKGFISLLFLGSLPLYYALLSRYISRNAALALTALVAVNPIIFKYTSDILSDTPYWAGSLGAIFAATRFQEAGSGKAKGLWFGLSVSLIILCALTRQIGLALVLAFLISLILNRQWRYVVIALVSFAVSVGGWQSYEHFYRSAHRSDISSLNQQGVQAVLDRSPIKLEYVKHFLIDKPVNLDENRVQTHPAILAENIQNRAFAYANVTLDQLLPGFKVKWQGQKMTWHHLLPLQLMVLGLLIWGLYQLRLQAPLWITYTIVYVGVLLVYPYISPRFLLPIYPLMLLCIYHAIRQGIAGLCTRLSTQARKPFQTVSLSILFGLALIASLISTIHWVNAVYQLKVANQGPSLRKSNAGYYRTLLWLEKNTPQNSLIISRKPPVTYFYSGRKSTAFPFTANAETLFGYIQEKKQRYGKQFDAIYVFEDTAFVESRELLTPALKHYQKQLQLVYVEPVTRSRVWRLL